MAATRATFQGLPRRHRRVWKSQMAELWRVTVTVTMYSIVRTEARPKPGTGRCPGSGGIANQRGDLAPVETPQLRQFGHEHGGRAVARRQVHDLPVPPSLKVTEHRPHAVCCLGCRTRTRAAFPAEVAEPVRFGQRDANLTTHDPVSTPALFLPRGQPTLTKNNPARRCAKQWRALNAVLVQLRHRLRHGRKAPGPSVGPLAPTPGDAGRHGHPALSLQ